MDMKNRLKEIIRTEGIVIGNNGELFTLSKGKTSPYYYDIKQAILTPDVLDMVGDLGLKIVNEYNARSVGGPASGSIPFATALMMKSKGTNNPIQSFFVRKEPKGHGRKKWIEGNIESPVVIVDDVITTGGSALNAIEKVEEAGYRVVAVVSIVDRNEGAERTFSERNIKFDSMFTHNHDFKKFIDQKILEKSRERVVDSVSLADPKVI